MKHLKLSLKYMSLFLACSVFVLSCDDFELPEAGSLPDETPPAAEFSYTANEADWMQIDFANLSISATTYSWDFGDGATSSESNPSHTYAGEGTFTVSLTASDLLNQTNTFTMDVVVEEPEISFTPTILNPGFDIEGEDSYRDGWRNSDLGGVIQITSSPIHDGEKAAKLPSAGDRIGYQLVTVLPETDYTVSFYYTMKTSPEGSVTVSILGGDVTDPAAVAGATLNSVVLDDQSDASTYVQASVSFNSGTSTQIAIFFTNVGVESRLDSFTITES